MKLTNILSFFFLLLAPLFLQSQNTKVLHLTLHRGCATEFEGVAKALSLDLTTWFIQAMPLGFIEGYNSGNAIYNIGHDRAERIWNLHKEYFNLFDVIITSDTAPLSRIFLQNGWDKPLIIWMCNRFDYHDNASLDCEFPDPEYYRLFQEALYKENVALIAYTKFEHYYAHTKGIDTGSLTITPCAFNVEKTVPSAIPDSIKKAETFFLPPYHNEMNFMDLSSHLHQLGIKNYCGRYNGGADLTNFKGIIHLPYSWSNLAFFENIAYGIPYFVPSRSFFKSMASLNHYFHPNINFMLDDDVYALSEWYAPEHCEIITYFDSWSDLNEKIQATDFPALREKIQAFAKQHQANTLEAWKNVFRNFKKDKPRQEP